MNLTAEVKREALRLGFDQVGVCPAVTPEGIHRFYEWLSAGHAGQMSYMNDRANAYEHPRHVLQGVRSLVMLTTNYRTRDRASLSPGAGHVSCYSWGSADYHDIIHERLKRLVTFVNRAAPESHSRGVVDTAPLLEREFAQLAGLGWIGKNTMLISPREGSWFFLAALLTDLELDYDREFSTDHCGTCRACLDACPTDAFPKPYVLDATRCISYLTIELRDSVPQLIRPDVGDWLFGCDICQEVCPWNRHAPIVETEAFWPREDLGQVPLGALFQIDDDGFRRLYRRTPLWRAKRRGILRNAAIVLGNQRHLESLEDLAMGLNDSEPLVRAACAWALGRLDSSRAQTALAKRRHEEVDRLVLEEIMSAMT